MGDKKRGNSAFRTLLLEKVLELSLCESADCFFTSLAAVFGEIFQVSPVYVSTFIEPRDLLQFEALYDPSSLLSFDPLYQRLPDSLEKSAIEEGSYIIEKNWQKDAKLEIFANLNDFYPLAIPFVHQGNTLGILTAWFPKESKISKKVARELDIAIKCFTPYVRKAIITRRRELELKSRRFLDRMLKYSYDNYDYPIDGIERLIISTLGASECHIDLLSHVDVDSKEFCCRPGVSQCTAIKKSRPIVSSAGDSCPYNVLAVSTPDRQGEHYLSCCVPLSVRDEDFAVLSVGFSDKLYLSYWDEMFIKSIGEILNGVLRNLSAALDYKELLANINRTGASSGTDAAGYSAPYTEFILRRLSFTLASLLKSDIIKVWMLTYDEKFLELISQWPKPQNEFKSSEISIDTGPAGFVVKNRLGYRSSDPLNDPIMAYPLSQAPNISSVLARPIFINKNLVGVVEIFRTASEHALTTDERIELNLSVILDKIALVIGRARLKRDNERTMKKLTEYANELEQKSHDLEVANERVRNINRRISMAYEFSRIFSSNIDIGKAVMMTLDTLGALLVDKPVMILTLIPEERGIAELHVADLRNSSTVKSLRIRLSEALYIKLLKYPEHAHRKIVLDASNGLTETLNDLSKILGTYSISELHVWPALSSANRLAAVIAAGFEKPTHLVMEDEQLFLAISYQMAISVRNGRLNRINAIERYRLNSIINSISDALITLDVDMNITACNHAALEILRLPEGELIKRSYTVLDQFLTYSRPNPLEEFKKLREQGNMDLFYYDFSYVDKNGNERFCNASVSSIHHEKRTFGFVLLARDITEQKLFERMRSDFVAVMAHDIRTPLTAVLNYTSLLSKHGDRLDEDRKKEFYNIIHSETARFARMLTELKNVDKIVDMAPEVDKVQFDLKDVFDKIANLFQLSADEHTIKIGSLPESTIITADRDDVEAILTNFVSNAVKYSSHDGSITLSAALIPENMIKISVTDQGQGISKEDSKLLFERYSRLEKDRNGSIQGIGLGLYNCKILAEANGGSVGVESELGVGSEFYFTLPL